MFCFMRPVCPDTYLSISDFASLSKPGPELAPVFLPPALPCISTKCLVQCRVGGSVSCGYDTGDRNCTLISGYNDDSFFRCRDIVDDTDIADLYKCLDYKCQSIVSQ